MLLALTVSNHFIYSTNKDQTEPHTVSVSSVNCQESFTCCSFSNPLGSSPLLHHFLTKLGGTLATADHNIVMQLSAWGLGGSSDLPEKKKSAPNKTGDE